MKKTALVTLVILLTMILTACTEKPTPAAIPSEVPEIAELPETEAPAQVVLPTESVTIAPQATEFSTVN